MQTRSYGFWRSERKVGIWNFETRKRTHFKLRFRKFFFFKNPLYFPIGLFRICKFSVLSLKESGLGQIVFSIVPCIAGFLPYPSISIYSCIGAGVRFRSLFDNFYICSGKRRLSARLSSNLLSSNRRQTNSRSGSERRFQRVSGKVWLDSGQIQETYQNFRLKRLLYPTFYLWWYHFNDSC